MYEWRFGMDEVSGLGGAYEQTVRSMIRAGMEWWDAHPQAQPLYKRSHGFFLPVNEDARALHRIVLEASGGQATGAMHRTAVAHVLWIRRHGWRRYVWVMRWRRVRSAWDEAWWAIRRKLGR